MTYGIILFLAGVVAALIKNSLEKAKEIESLSAKLKDASEKIEKVVALSQKYRKMAAATERGEYQFIELPDDLDSSPSSPKGVPGNSE